MGSRILRIVLIVLAAVIVLAVAAVAWLAGTASGARFALSTIAGKSSGLLKTEGVHGTLAGPLQIDRMVINKPGQHVELDKVTLDWQPSALMHGLLHVRSLHAGKIEIISTPNPKKEPAQLPNSIDLPVAVRIDHAQIDGGRIALGKGNTLQLDTTVAALDFDHRRYRLQLQKASVSTTSGGKQFDADLHGQLTLHTNKPYPLQGNFSLGAGGALGNQPLRADSTLQLGGSLADLTANIEGSINQARLNGSSTLHPFADNLLGATQMHISALDLSSFSASLPKTALSGTVTVAADGKGTLALQNALAGPYNEQKVPVREVHAAFAQQQNAFAIDSLRALLGSAAQQAGTLSGNARIGNGHATVALKLDDVNLHRLDEKLQETRLGGNVDLKQQGSAQQFAVDLHEPFGKQHIALNATGGLANQTLTLDHARLKLGQGSLDVTGHADLSGAQAFAAEGELHHFHPQDLGQFGQLPDMLLNGHFNAAGRRAPGLAADVSFRIVDSRIAGNPLQGEGKVSLKADRIEVPNLQLVAGSNRLAAHGTLADGRGQLSFALDAPRLAQLGNAFAGSLHADGTASGSLERPKLVLAWNASQLRLPGAIRIAAAQGKADIAIDRKSKLMFDSIRADASTRGIQTPDGKIASVVLQARFAPQPRAPLALNLQVAGIDLTQLQADSAAITADGTTGSHVLHAELREPSQRENWTLAASGGLHDLSAAPRWQGTIDRFDAQGKFVAHLVQPAPLLASQARIRLDNFQLESNTISVTVERFARDANGIVTRGHIGQLNIGQLLRLANQKPPIDTDLRLAGAWDLTISNHFAGTVNFRRLGGDVTIHGDVPIALGLQRLDGSAVAKNGTLQLQFNADGQQLGHIDVQAQTETGGPKRFAVSPDAPLSGHAVIDMPSLAWAGPLISPTARTGGSLQANALLAGTVSNPQLTGNIDGKALQVRLGDLGVDLRQGMLHGEFQNDTLQLRELVFHDASTGASASAGATAGTVQLSGPIGFSGGKPSVQIALRADRFMLLNRSDRKLTLSGNGTLGLQNGDARAVGNFHVDSGFIDIGRQDMPHLSKDVVIVGREEKASKPIPATVDLTVNLGNDLQLQGYGLDATLEGQLRITSEPGEPLQANGKIQVAKGTFSAYGRDLAIEKGVLKFSGSLTNPALDIVAMRAPKTPDQELAVKAGVSVQGTALAPRVTLISDPDVPDADKLAWLVLGHGLDNVSNTEMGSLQSAASKLLSQGALGAVQSRLASAFGLDELSLSTSDDTLQQRVVTIGKRLSSRLYVSIQRSLETASSVVLLRYKLTDHLTVQAEAGALSALSLLYDIAFD